MSSICKIENCDKFVHGLRLCNKHYKRYKIYGDPTYCKWEPDFHGKIKTAEYRAWYNMKQRTSNPKSSYYALYGGRGIKVCDRWQRSFVSFLEDMGAKPYPDYSLDRINTDGNYEPGNCRWVNLQVQVWNQRKKITNTSGFIGVVRANGAWGAQCGTELKGERHNTWLGTFKDPEQAALAYDKYVIFMRGEYAVTNYL